MAVGITCEQVLIEQHLDRVGVAVVALTDGLLRLLPDAHHRRIIGSRGTMRTSLSGPLNAWFGKLS